MKKIISKKVAIIIAISIIPSLFLLTVIVLVALTYVFGHPVSDDKLKSIATTYAKAKCRAAEKDNKFVTTYTYLRFLSQRMLRRSGGRYIFKDLTRGSFIPALILLATEIA